MVFQNGGKLSKNKREPKLSLLRQFYENLNYALTSLSNELVALTP